MLREWRTRTWLRLKALLNREQFDRDLGEELQFHVARREEKLASGGVDAEEAHLAARRQFGSTTSMREATREMWTISWLENLWQDLRYGARVLRRNPGFTATAILTLALGIGSNVAIFSMVDGILLRPLPYTQPDQIYAIREIVPQFTEYGPSLPVNGGNFLAWKDSPAFWAMTLIGPADGSLLGVGRPQWLYGAAVTSDFFSILGAQPLMGRAFLPADETSGGKPEILLMHHLWRDQFHSDPDILGRIVNLGGHAMTVIGVLPVNFIFPHILAHDPEYFVPFPWEKWNSRPGISSHNYSVIARLKSGVTPRQAESQLNVIEARIAQNDSGGKFNLFATLTPLKTEIVGPTRTAILMLSMAAGLVLLIVCANLANLLLVKNSQRVREFALRLAFGAGRWRLIRQFLTETLVLASAGAGLGLLLAKGGLWLLVRNAPVGIPRVDQIRLDSTVLWFTLAVTIFTAFLFGLLPSLRATPVHLTEVLKSSGPTVSAGKQGARLRAALVIGEIALCGALLPACLLLIRSLRHVVLANQWMNEEHVITADLLVRVPVSQNPTDQDFERAFHQRNNIFTSIEEKVLQLPGVESTGFISTLPLQGSGWGDTINFQEKPLPDAQQPGGEFRFVSPGYFRTIGLPLIKGRYFTEEDRGQSVAVISERVARSLLRERDPLGMNVFCGNIGFGPQKWCRVVGEVTDVRAEPDQAPLLAVYFPLWVNSELSETLVVRTRMDPTAATDSIRQAIWTVDPELAIPEEKTLKTILANVEAPRRYETSLVSLFALCAALLAMLGLYAVISYSVSQRGHEIGIRMALGAQRTHVLRMVIREAMLLAGAGIAVGIAGALALTRFLGTLLFEIQPADPPTFVGVAILLAIVALMACWIPARRATRVDPMVALRHD